MEHTFSKRAQAKAGTVAVDRQAVANLSDHYKALAADGNMDGIRGMETLVHLLIDTDIGPDVEIVLESASAAFDAHWRKHMHGADA